MTIAPREELMLPEAAQLHGRRCPMTRGSDDIRLGVHISSWLEDKTADLRRIWAGNSSKPIGVPISDPAVCAEHILDVLAHRKFNHQPRGRIVHHFPALKHCLGETIQTERPITFFLLFNGGYRASPWPGHLDLIFEPDQTELMLLHQIALLQQRITAFYALGINFVIVVNNGVARWVNGIPRDLTEEYVRQLRHMIRQTGAADRIHVLCQSELPGYSDTWQGGGITPSETITNTEHRLVERFLGRRCDDGEARFRSALYPVAEAIWAEVLRPLAEAQNAVVLRQVAHPASLSFRPFPGGAIRTQNGTLGFSVRNGVPIPTLITTSSFERHTIRPVAVNLPIALRSAHPTHQVAAHA